MALLLIVTRHAKAETHATGLKDFDRVLITRGRHDASRIGAKVAAQGVFPDIIVTSPASRAADTALLFAEQFKIPTQEVVLNEEIYEASLRILLRIVNQLENNYKSVMIVGHNPGLLYLIELITGEIIGHLPTSGCCGIEFPFDDWQQVSANSGTLKFFFHP